MSSKNKFILDEKGEVVAETTKERGGLVAFILSIFPGPKAKAVIIKRHSDDEIEARSGNTSRESFLEEDLNDIQQ